MMLISATQLGYECIPLSVVDMTGGNSVKSLFCSISHYVRYAST
jgi:hypothetical protein